MGYIYKIENTINGKIYIGKTDYFDVTKRWKEHKRAMNREDCKHRPLYRAFNKYGIENFKFSVIEETNNTSEREVYWINFYDAYNNGYNLTLGGDGRSYVTIDIDNLQAYYKNHNFLETSEHFDVSPKTLRNIMKQNGIDIVSSVEIQKNNAKSVVQMTKDGKIVHTYDSCHEAEMAISGLNKGVVSEVCRGIRKSAFGYVWQYAA